MNSRSQDDSRLTMAEEAAEWVITLEDEGRIERRSAFIAWARQSQYHVEEYLLADATYCALNEAAAVHRIDLEGLLRGAESNVVPLRAESSPVAGAGIRRSDRLKTRPAVREREEASESTAAGHVPHRRWRWTAMGASLLAAVLGVVASAPKLAATPTVHATEFGERNLFTLDDGSSVHLNTESRVEVLFTKTAREVRLLEGEALFDIRHDPARPFRVISAGTVIQDVGTRFNVSRSPEGTTVSVLEGRVQVYLAAAPIPCVVDQREPECTLFRNVTLKDPPLVALLGANDQVRITTTHVNHPTMTLRKLPREQLFRIVAWTQDQIWFNGDSLGEAVRQFNRYNRRKLVIADPEIATVNIGGHFETTDLDSFIHALEKSFDFWVEAPDSTGSQNIHRAPRN